MSRQNFGTEAQEVTPLHGYLTAAYRYEIGPVWSVQPSGLLRVRTNAPLSYDVGVRTLWQDRLWVGAAYRSSQEWVALAGVHISALMSLGYAFDTAGARYGSSSHEVVLNLRFFNAGRVLCPQYLW